MYVYHKFWSKKTLNVIFVCSQEELEKVKKRRLEREREKAERQESIVLEQRSREREYFAQWESQEDSFHLNQVEPSSF